MKKLLAIILLTFTFSLFLTDAHASPNEAREPVKNPWCYRGYHFHWRLHRHHHNHRKFAMFTH